MGSRRKRTRRKRQREIRILRSKVYDLEWELMMREVGDMAERMARTEREYWDKLDEGERERIGVV